MRRAEATDPVDTDRLVLTPVGVDDVNEVILLHEDAGVARWTGPWTRATTEAWTLNMVERWTLDGVGKWFARDRLNGSLVGRGGFTRLDLEGEEMLEVGWAVRDHLTGRGYATEIGIAALEWAAVFFPDLPVVSFTEVHNLASQAVMRHLGMREAEVILREGLIEGRLGLHPEAPFVLYRR